jgi:hypothetical protein
VYGGLPTATADCYVQRAATIVVVVLLSRAEGPDRAHSAIEQPLGAVETLDAERFGEPCHSKLVACGVERLGHAISVETITSPTLRSTEAARPVQVSNIPSTGLVVAICSSAPSRRSRRGGG